MSLENNFTNAAPQPVEPVTPQPTPPVSPAVETNAPVNQHNPVINNPYSQPATPLNEHLAPIPMSQPAMIQPNLPQDKVVTPKKKGSSFIHRLEIFAVILILLVATFFAIILIAPESPFSQAVVKNTFLSQLINVEPTNTEDNTSTGTTVQNTDNDTDEDDNTETTVNRDELSPFVFITPGDAKTVVEIVDEVLPSVLSITVQQSNASGIRTQSLVAGTGFIVSNTGLVITNKHVISPQCQFGQSVEVVAANQDNDVYKLKLLTVDPIYDIALLQIQNPPSNLRPVSFADVKTVKLGTEVVAIGNALGELQNTVTRGIVSGLSRSVTTNLVDECTNSPVFADGLIQTDAAINQGNSGGPLFNAAGQLIGMNTFGTEGAENIGLAIPSTAIVSALNSYKDNGIIARPKMGIYSQSITPLLEDTESWLPVDYGEIVVAPTGETAVERGSAADIAGLKEGDIILEINGTPVESTQSNPSPLRRALLSFKPGDKVTMKILKSTGASQQGFNYESEPVEVAVTLGQIVFEIN